jgi:hypothetical protein
MKDEVAPEFVSQIRPFFSLPDPPAVAESLLVPSGIAGSDAAAASAPREPFVLPRPGQGSMPASGPRLGGRGASAGDWAADAETEDGAAASAATGDGRPGTGSGAFVSQFCLTPGFALHPYGYPAPQTPWRGGSGGEQAGSRSAESSGPSGPSGLCGPCGRSSGCTFVSQFWRLAAARACFSRCRWRSLRSRRARERLRLTCAS